MAKVLIVDDNRFSRRMLQKYVKALGHETEEGVHGLDGLAKIDAFAPDIILSDLLMPEMDGFEFVSALRAKGYTQPIVVITADIQSGVRDDVLARGANCFINKPFTEESVAAAMAEAMGSVS